MGARVVASLIVNVVIAVMTPVAWLQLMFSRGGDDVPLADRGLHSLRYFTVLSNLLSGAVSLVCVVALVGFGPTLPAWLLAIRLVAAAVVMLTFTVVIVLLVPVYDLKSMYAGGNLWMHLVLPLLAAVDCCFLLPVGSLPWPATFLAIVPTALYGTWYLRNIFRRSAKEDVAAYDFYHFLRWGWNKVPVVVAAALASTWAIALILYGVSRW